MGGLAGSAMGGGGGRGLNFSNEDTNFNVTDEQCNKVFTSSDQRNLVLKYKKSKPGGGGAATYKPSDIKKVYRLSKSAGFPDPGFASTIAR